MELTVLNTGAAYVCAQSVRLVQHPAMSDMVLTLP